MHTWTTALFWAWVAGLLLWGLGARRDPKFLVAWPYVALATGALTVFLAWHWWGHEGAKTVVARFRGPNADAELAAAGQAGDLFGGFNALFASLAFVAAAGALIFQASAMKAAQRQLALQAFEPLFLNLMNIHERIAATATVEMQFLDYENGQFYQSIVPIDKAAAEIARELPTYNWFVSLRLKEGVTDAHRAKRLGEFYEGIYREHSNEHALGPYFRSLYHIFKFVKNADLPYAQKVSYSNIARSILGKGHLLLLALNCLTKYGEGFKPLVEEFGLLKHIAEHEPQGAESELEWLIVKWCYSPTARLPADEREKYWQKHANERPPPTLL